MVSATSPGRSTAASMSVNNAALAFCPLNVFHEMEIGHGMGFREQSDDGLAERPFRRGKNDIEASVPSNGWPAIEQGRHRADDLGRHPIRTVFRQDVPRLERHHPLLEPHFGSLELPLKLVHQRLDPARRPDHIPAGEHAEGVEELSGRRREGLVQENARKKGLEEIADEAL